MERIGLWWWRNRDSGEVEKMEGQAGGNMEMVADGGGLEQWPVVSRFGWVVNGGNGKLNGDPDWWKIGWRAAG